MVLPHGRPKLHTTILQVENAIAIDDETYQPAKIKNKRQQGSKKYRQLYTLTWPFLKLST